MWNVMDGGGGRGRRSIAFFENLTVSTVHENEDVGMVRN
jgi:hypothetical protein